MLLSEKYTPTTLNSVIGNRLAVEKLAAFGVEAQKGGRIKPLLICGPSGTGKTAAVHALAYSNGFELLELNASDYRNEEKLNKLLMPASRSNLLFSKKLLILLDEVDELSNKFDSGSEKIISQLIKTSRHPVVFIANDFWNRKISFLRESVEKLEFKKVSKEEVLDLLRTIVKKENKSVEEKVLQEIAQRSNGDVRGAINDLELMIDAKPELIENLGVRDRKVEVFGVLDKIFLSRNFEIARNAYTVTDLDSGMLMNWVEENIPNRYTSKNDLNNAYAQLARASFFMEKAERTNYYGYLRYSGTIMSSGVSLSTGGNISLMKSYSFPASIRYLSKTKAARSATTKIVSKLIYRLHAHKKDIMNEYLPLIRSIVENAKKEEKTQAEIYDFFERVYGLEKDDVEAIMGG